MAPIQIKVCGSWLQIMHKHTQHCCCQASLTDQLKKWRVQKEKPWLTWHNIPIFLYTWDVAWARAPNRTQNKQCTIWGGVNLIPEPWGNFPGQGRSISNYPSRAINPGWGRAKKQAVHVHWVHCPVWCPCVWGDQSSNIVNNSFKNNNFIVLILAFKILWW